MKQSTLNNETYPLGFVKNGLDKKGLIVKVVTVTPEMAESWLKRNKSNRPLNNTILKFLLSEIGNGNWKMSNDCISFDVNGILINGQHRLNAVVVSGKSLQFMVAVGMEPESFKIMDTGKGRNGSDVLSIMGYKNYALLAATATFVFRYNSVTASQAAQHGGSVRLSNTDLLEYVQSNEDMPGIVADGLSIFNSSDKLLTASWVCSMYYLIAQRANIEKARDFINRLCCGNNLSMNSPIRLLRKRLTKDKMDKYNTMNKTVKLALVIKAWNYFISGTEVKVLRFDQFKDKFPTIKPFADSK